MSNVTTLPVSDYDAAKSAVIKLIARQCEVTEVQALLLLARWGAQATKQDTIIVNSLVKMLECVRNADGHSPDPILSKRPEKEIA